MDSEWNTTNWNREKIRAAMQTLSEEVDTSDDPERRALAGKMVMRLLRNHEIAKEIMDEHLEELLPTSHGRIRRIGATRCFRMAALVALITEEMQDKVSREHVVRRQKKIGYGWLMRHDERVGDALHSNAHQ